MENTMASAPSGKNREPAPFPVEAGSPHPLRATPSPWGVNFSLASLSDVKHAANEEDIAAMTADLARMKAEHAKARADHKAKQLEKINQLDKKIRQHLHKTKRTA